MFDSPFHKYVLGHQTKKAKGDPVPTFLHIFYSNDVVGTRRLKPAEDPASRHSFKNIIIMSGEEAGAVQNSTQRINEI
jgi:hypothetical protein